MHLTRRLAAAATLTAALFAGILASAGPATAMSPCSGSNPPDYCFSDPPPPAPAAPTALRATAVLQTTVSLTWSIADTTNTEHVVRTINGVSNTFPLPAGATTFNDPNAPAGTAITYAVSATACNDYGCTDGGATTIQVTTHPSPATPAGAASGGAYCTTYYCPKNPPAYTMRGWAIDWDTTAPIQVALIEDGSRTVATLTANATSATNSQYPGYGDNHGFSTSVLTGSSTKGNHTVCAVGLNVGVAGPNTTLGCFTYYTPGPPSPATNLTTTSYSTYVTVTFTDTANDETGYYLQRSTDAGASWLQVGSQYPALAGTGTHGTATDYSTVPSGTCYRILMVNGYGQTASAAACTS
ncbi:hypothetical protein N865_19980 [Intrasporangium oryzae NRRL B-24470]|uniref:Fibronectin type-III domain-containing protein n=1 Tax=Intrasporangium oryzae NRRL B-24470 TaxID=1386089 RepID=W9G3K1_9MICO|nr:hypothetical protein [Intrasporangium oryzae]EWS99886.1 hypothetical protein N865_19980 [Intrasporangium oryzae NRRL B-24470]